MKILRKIFGNARKPEGALGKMMVQGMNGGGHAALAKWGFEHISLIGNETVLDCGCGGGANVSRLLSMLPNGMVYGLDYSEVSVNKSKQVNAKGIQAGHCEILQGNVAKLPFADGRFELVTAFETVYFWPGIADCFKEVCRVMKDGGLFMIVNESDGKNEKSLRWTKIIDGMTVYTADELKETLIAAGFSKTEVDDDVSKDRLVVKAWK
ncbi:MAG: class I SAM-dependent methyltransferase [Oscillospiraceae bacterium]|nr:class I SAM-dependent methyltransferase [Oscillospiraceae bacterium]